MRVFGLGSKARFFYAVCTHGSKNTELANAKDPQEIVRLLKVRKTTLLEKRPTLPLTTRRRSKLSISPGALTKFLQDFLWIKNENQNAISAIGAEIFEIERESEGIQNRIIQTARDANAQITIVLHANVATALELQLSYSEFCFKFSGTNLKSSISSVRRVVDSDLRTTCDDRDLTEYRSWPFSCRLLCTDFACSRKTPPVLPVLRSVSSWVTRIDIY